MRNGIITLCALLLSALPPALPALAQQNSDAVPAKLNKRTEALIAQQIVPAYQMSDRLQLLQSLSTATARMKPEHLEVFDDRLQFLGMPPAGKMMVDAYLSLLTQGEDDSLPEPGLREMLVMVPELNQSIQRVLVAIEDSVATLEPLPRLDTLEDYEGLFWEIHVLQNKIEEAARFARYGGKLVDRMENMRTGDLEDRAMGLVGDFNERVERLEAAHRDLEQRQLEFRLDRMELAKKTLGEAGNFVEKMQAAFAGHLDTEMFRRVFEAAEPRQFERERLQAGDLKAHTEQLAKQIDALSGDLKPKSQLFYQGLHWWLRGRYGRGPERNGLLKNVRVVNDERLMFPLYIPEGMGKPPHELIRNPQWQASGEGPEEQAEVTPYIRVETEGGLSPDYPRRHHYGWMFEYRQTGPQQDVMTTKVVGERSEYTQTTVHTSHFY